MPDKCQKCGEEKELRFCSDCWKDLYSLMISKMMEVDPSYNKLMSFLQWENWELKDELKEIKSEIEELKNVLKDFKIRGFNLKSSKK